MKASYPKPRNDSGIGLVYAPPGHGYDLEVLGGQISELESMRVRWLVVLADGVHPIPEDFLRTLLARDIEPIVGLHPPFIKPFNQATLKNLLESYARTGVHYLYAYCEPNMMRSWAWEDWTAADVVSRFMEMLIPCLRRAYEVGLYPLLSPLRPGGDYWDLAFLTGMLRGLQQETQLLDRAAIAIQSYTFHHPSDWGAGGRSEWHEAWPYHTLSSCQDHLGLRLFEWYDEIVRGTLGYSLPLISVAGGTAPGAEIWDEEAHKKATMDLLQKFRQDGLPDYLFNQTVGSLTVDDSQAGRAWYRADGTSAKGVAVLEDLSQEAVCQPAGSGNNGDIYHYLLFPSWEDGMWESHRQIAGNYLDRFRPSYGSDLREAASARYVTILNRYEMIGKRIEAYLGDRGCEAECIYGPDVQEIQRTLDEMAETGTRFLTLKEDKDG